MDGNAETGANDQPDATASESSMFSSLHLRTAFNCPCTIVGLPIACNDNRILDPLQGGNPKERWIGSRLADRARKVSEATIRKLYGL